MELNTKLLKILVSIIFNKLAEKIEHNPRNISSDKNKNIDHINSIKNTLTKNSKSKENNKFLATESFLHKVTPESQLEYLKMKLMNKKKLEFKQSTNQLNFTNPSNQFNNESGNISNSMSNNTNGMGNNGNNFHKVPHNYQIFLKNPLNTNSEKEKHLTNKN